MDDSSRRLSLVFFFRPSAPLPVTYLSPCFSRLLMIHTPIAHRLRDDRVPWRGLFFRLIISEECFTRLILTYARDPPRW